MRASHWIRRAVLLPGRYVARLLVVSLSLSMLFVGLRDSPASAGAPVHRVFEPRDPLVPMLSRARRFLHTNEVNGVVLDWRYAVSPSEEIRQSVVCQLLGDVELARVLPSAALLQDIVERADFLIARLDTVSSHTPFDGMLGHSLLAAYEVTGEQRFFDAGRIVSEEMAAIPTGQCILNGGLMVAMNMAEFHRLTGDSTAARKAADILGLLPAYQHEDGSFPHWCVGSRDIHYTGWMAMELIHLGRLTGDPRIAPMLSRMAGFLEARLDSSGMSRYEEPCPGDPSCTIYYYSRASGCAYDYDTRCWTVEPAYTTLALWHVGSPRYGRVVRFLGQLEHGGVWRDVWDHVPPPSDPEYPWTIADSSVVNTSIIYWALATIASAPAGGTLPPPRFTATAALSSRAPVRVPLAALRGVSPQPAIGPCEVRFVLRRAATARLSIVDAQGRRVRVFPSEHLAAGAHAPTWDLRDGRGMVVPAGVYLVVLEVGGEQLTARLVVVR